MAEYIEREKAIERIKPHVKPTTVYGEWYIQATEHALDILELIPAADVQPVDRWISVDETLPVYNSRVLVYDVSKNIRIGIYTEIGWCSQYENPLIYKVTHWQPLPEPPKPTE